MKSIELGACTESYGLPITPLVYSQSKPLDYSKQTLDKSLMRPIRSPPPEGNSCTSEASSENASTLESNHCNNTKEVGLFKANPKNSLSYQIMDSEQAKKFEVFRQRALITVARNNSVINSNMRRSVANDEKNADPAYREKRRKNNESVKRSRDAKKAKEHEMVFLCSFLDNEIQQKRHENEFLKNEIDEVLGIVNQ